jgi:hypothetical protein
LRTFLEKIKREVIPDIRKHESEYGKLLYQSTEAVLISDAEAEDALVEIEQAAKYLEIQPTESYPEELISLLQELREKLDDPGKTAAAKLKVALPIVPLLASYELEMDTEALMTQAWRQVKSIFRR